MSSPNPDGVPPPSDGPPYLPQGAGLGGVPNNSVDTPICAVLIALFLGSAIMHMLVFQVNRRRDHKFIFSFLIFAFSMARIVALVLRIVWANRQTNVDIAIAANVFTSAGIVILFIVNILFAKRIVRGYHPSLAGRALNWTFLALVLSVVAVLFMVIPAAVITFFETNPSVLETCRDIQRVGQTYMAALAFLPIPIVLITMLFPRHNLKKFGLGRWRTKLFLILGTSFLLALGAGFRAGIAFDPRPINDPAWYHSKACYYIFNYAVEIVVVYAYGIVRFDQRFHIPPELQGARGPGAHQALQMHGSVLDRTVNTEAAVFGDSGDSPDETKFDHA